LKRKSGERLASRVTKKDHPRIEECRDMLVALTPVQYDAIVSVLRGFTGQGGNPTCEEGQEVGNFTS
jgi:hypothetical protein